MNASDVELPSPSHAVPNVHLCQLARAAYQAPEILSYMGVIMQMKTKQAYDNACLLWHCYSVLTVLRHIQCALVIIFHTYDPVELFPII